MNSSPLNSSTPPAPAALPIAHPLDEFYAQMGMTLPPIEQVQGGDVPEPYKTLLVHNHDMTPTLEQFYHENLHLLVFRREYRGDFYFREVALVLDSNEQPVEFGAIKINLALCSPAARRQILEEHVPLGHILQSCAVPHTSRPKGFLRVQSDDFINQSLKLSGEHLLYGRRNTLFDAQERPLAEILEILPPASK
jgi:chorismate-pyruvate lyase